VTTAATILEGIAEPGRTLALCDETDLTTTATATMVAHIHAWVAFCLKYLSGGKRRPPNDIVQFAMRRCDPPQVRSFAALQ
jgi:hypothetical protein